MDAKTGEKHIWTVEELVTMQLAVDDNGLTVEEAVDAIALYAADKKR